MDALPICRSILLFFFLGQLSPKPQLLQFPLVFFFVFLYFLFCVHLFLLTELGSASLLAIIIVPLKPVESKYETFALLVPNMSSERKGPASHSDFETDSHQDTQYQSRLKAIRLVDSARIGLTGLALLCGLAVLGTSANSLAVYNATHLPREYNFPLWPNKFDLRPTMALVVCSVIVVLANAVSLVFSKVQTVSLAPTTPRAGAAAGLRREQRSV